MNKYKEIIDFLEHLDIDAEYDEQSDVVSFVRSRKDIKLKTLKERFPDFIYETEADFPHKYLIIRHKDTINSKKPPIFASRFSVDDLLTEYMQRKLQKELLKQMMKQAIEGDNE